MQTSNFRIFHGMRRFHEAAPILAALRSRHNLQHDLSTDPNYLLSMNDRRIRKPVVVVLLNSLSEPEAAVIFFERCIFGIGVGVLRAGDHAGDCSVLAAARQRGRALIAAMELLIKNRRYHSVFGAVADPDYMDPSGRSEHVGDLDTVFRTVRRKLALKSHYEDMVSSFGHKMRRGIRTGRRKLETEYGVEFLPDLSYEEALEALSALSQISRPVRSPWAIRQYAQFLSEHSETFAMGLRLKGGSWLSLVAGWRSGGVTYISWAMHNLGFQRESIAKVMNSYLLEHEIGLQQGRVQWVGGTADLWARVCEPESCLCVTRLRSDFLSVWIRMLIFRFQKGSAMEYFVKELEEAKSNLAGVAINADPEAAECRPKM